ncbi:hypothetical protein P389DRAFT_193402 [Cystobasidium minutum MCA 4210]|uniref:uncharacterized protein n=1 Tax=Cystobasidium minutum MCA 4210 TaxID=1397322 RepID=UPI0034CFE916|eukprot:jgi/Rhomi1/193402/gm1.1616_g
MLSRTAFTTARTALRARSSMARNASTAIPKPHGGPKSMLSLEPEVYPLLAIVGLACSVGTYVGFHKLSSDANLRLYKNDKSKPVHQPLAYQERKFGQQAGGHTYKDRQGWTMVATGTKDHPVERASLMTPATPEQRI